MNNIIRSIRCAAEELQIDYEIVKYGVIVEFCSLLDISLALLFGYLIGRLKESTTFICVFSFLRVYCGGYHCGSIETCALLYVFMVVTGSLFVGKLSFFFEITLVMGTYTYLLFVCPVEHENNPLTKTEKLKYAKIVKIRLTVILGIYGILLHFNDQLHSIVAAVYLWLFMLCVFQKMKGDDNNEENGKNVC